MRLSFLTTIILTVFAFTVWGEEVNKIIVKVNNQIITSRDLDEYCEIIALRIFDGDKEVSTADKEFRANALRRLVEDTLVLDKAKQDQVKVSSSRIEGKVNQLISFHPSREEFEQSLKDKGLTITLLRQKVKEQYMLRDAVDRYVKSRISVLPKEISGYYVEYPDKFYSSEGYIFYIAKTKDNSVLEKISRVIKKGRILEAQAQYSNILYKVESNKDELKPRILKLLTSLHPGKHRIEKIDDIFYLIYLEKAIPPYKLPLEKVKEKIYAYLWDVKFREKFARWVDELKKDAVIKNYYE